MCRNPVIEHYCFHGAFTKHHDLTDYSPAGGRKHPHAVVKLSFCDSMGKRHVQPVVEFEESLR